MADVVYTETIGEMEVTTSFQHYEDFLDYKGLSQDGCDKKDVPTLHYSFEELIRQLKVLTKQNNFTGGPR